MSLRIVVLAAAAFACQVNAQIGGIVRPFAAGFTTGLNDMAKPYVPFGQGVMAPPRPPMSQWMSYPSQILPQGGPYEGYDPAAPGMPGVSYFQVMRPNPAFKPQVPFYAVQSGFVRPPPPPPPPPRPTPTPSASSSEESDEAYRPSNLLVQPEEVAEVPEGPEVPLGPEGNIEIPTLQRPLPIVEDQE